MKCHHPKWENRRDFPWYVQVPWRFNMIFTIQTKGIIMAGWWFGTFFIFPYIGNSNPNWLICFKMVETTNQMGIDYQWWCGWWSRRTFIWGVETANSYTASNSLCLNLLDYKGMAYLPILFVFVSHLYMFHMLYYIYMIYVYTHTITSAWYGYTNHIPWLSCEIPWDPTIGDNHKQLLTSRSLFKRSSFVHRSGQIIEAWPPVLVCIGATFRMIIYCAE